MHTLEQIVSVINCVQCIYINAPLRLSHTHTVRTQYVFCTKHKVKSPPNVNAHLHMWDGMVLEKPIYFIVNLVEFAQKMHLLSLEKWLVNIVHSPFCAFLIMIMRICVFVANRNERTNERTGYAMSLLLIKFMISHGFFDELAFLFRWATAYLATVHNIFAFIVEIVTSSRVSSSSSSACSWCVCKSAINKIQKIQYWLSHIHWDLVCKYWHRKLSLD